jgi:hypothetical protein
MEVDMLHAAGQALVIILDPHRLIYLFAGVCMGLGLGLLPGIGGIAGTAMLLPFTYGLDPHAAFALLLGLGATTTTADPISAILFGVPGHAASAATRLDGYPLTRKGQAGRALGAMLRPIVIVMFALALAGLLRSFLGDVRAHGGARQMLAGFRAPRFGPGNLLPAALICVVVTMLLASRDWGIEAKIIPVIVGGGALLFCALTLANEVFGKPAGAAGTGPVDGILPEGTSGRQKMHMDIESHIGHLPTRVKLLRGALFFGWMAAFLASMATIGLVATVPLFIIAYMRSEGRERWSLTLPMAIGTTLFIYVLFDRVLAIPWPQTLLGAVAPGLKVIPGV